MSVVYFILFYFFFPLYPSPSTTFSSFYPSPYYPRHHHFVLLTLYFILPSLSFFLCSASPILTHSFPDFCLYTSATDGWLVRLTLYTLSLILFFLSLLTFPTLPNTVHSLPLALLFIYLFIGWNIYRVQGVRYRCEIECMWEWCLYFCTSRQILGRKIKMRWTWTWFGPPLWPLSFQRWKHWVGFLPLVLTSCNKWI